MLRVGVGKGNEFAHFLPFLHEVAQNRNHGGTLLHPLAQMRQSQQNEDPNKDRLGKLAYVEEVT